MAMRNLGILLAESGDLEGALQLLRNSLTGQSKLLGEKHPDTVATAELFRRVEAQAHTGQPSGS